MPIPDPRRGMPWHAPAAAAACLCLLAVGWLLAGSRPALAWVVMVAIAAVAGAAAWLRPAPAKDDNGRAALEAALADKAEQHRRLRHDLRGVLSPALLTADRLLNNPEPSVKRAGEMMVLAVERASALMADPEPVSPPGGP